MVTISLDKERHLRFDVNAICDLEEATGKSLVAIIQEAGDVKSFGLQVRSIRAMLWAGLKHEDPTLTVTGVGDVIQKYAEKRGGFGDIMPKVMQAIISSGFIKAEEAKPEEGAADPQPGA